MYRPTAGPRRLLAVLITLLIAGLGIALPARPALAAPSTAVTITTPSASVPGHSRVPFNIGFAVTGEPLLGAQLQVVLPGDRWTSSDLRQIGGLSRFYVASGGNLIATWNLGDVPPGTTGSVQLEARTLHTVLPHGTVVSLTADLSGTNASTVTSAPASITLEAIGEAALAVSDQGAIAAPGPAGTPGGPGFEVRYRVRPSAICVSFTDEGYPEACLPVVGTLSGTVPANSWLVRVTAVRPPAANVALWNLPPGTPWDLSGIPPVIAPGGALSIPIRAYHVRTYPDGDGNLDQASVLNAPCPCPPGLFDSFAPPELEVVLWVPEPPSPIDLSATFTFAGSNGQGGTTSSTDEHTVLVTNDNALHLEKFTPGCGPLLVAGNRPFISCVLPYNVEKDYWTDITTTGSVIDPVVTDVLPPELIFYSSPAPPAGWTPSYSTLAGCSQSTPDASFSSTLPSTPSDVRCVRWRFSGVFAGFARVSLAARRNPAVSLAPGTYMLTTNRVFGTGANVQPVSAERPQWLWNVWDGVTTKFGPNVIEPGQTFNYQLFAIDSHAYGDVGPRDYTVVDVLAPELEYLGHTVISAPHAPGGGFLPMTCGYTPATREFKCVAPGQAADSSVPVETFRVDVQVRVADPISTPRVMNTVCGWADSLEGPLDELGQPLTWSTNRYAKSCSTMGSNVEAVPVVFNTKVLTAPASGPVAPGSLVSYRIDYGHVLPQSATDLVDGYLYDFPGRDPLTGTPTGDATPAVVSAAAGGPEQLEYTCGSNASLATLASLTWSAAPCASVTGVRWRLMSGDASAPPGTYRRTDPPGSVTITVRVPDDARHGAHVVNQSAIVGQDMNAAASAPVDAVVDRPIDLAIDKTHDSGFGENGTWRGAWRLAVRNNGPYSVLPGEAITVTDTLPASVTLLSATGAGWSCTAAVPTVTCTRPGPLAPGASLPDIVVEVRATAGSHTNTATVSTTAHDTTPTNDTDTDSVTVRPLVTARAWGLRSELPLLGNLALGDTGEVSARGDRHVNDDVVRRDVGTALSALLLSGVVDIADGPAGSGPWTGDATGTVDRVVLNVAGVRIAAENLVAASHSTCDGRTQSASISRLTVNNQVINTIAPAPNTTINAGLVTITINERASGAVTALRIRVAGVVDLRLAYARSAVDCGT